uniref:Uncharacterized protein n=1 Tax=Rhizophora mucronata TaxID=61149 RepID=A0A2P2NWU3_RHIMU
MTLVNFLNFQKTKYDPSRTFPTNNLIPRQK